MRLVLACILITLVSCEELKSNDKKGLNILHLLADETVNYRNPSTHYKISFPAAHDPKKSYRHEWWYISANLTTQTGDDFAVQWTLFRTAIKNKHWYFAHAALANEDTHLSALRSGREALGNVIIQNKPFKAQIDNWFWHSSSQLLPAKLEFSDVKDEQKWHAKLNLIGRNQFYLQGDQGYNRKHASLDIASHYYSQPFIDVTGEIFFKGQLLKVKGKAWFDREWGTQMLAPDQQGWDWFSLRLNSKLALMVYRIRSVDKEHLYASLMHDNGIIETLPSEEINLMVKQTKKGKYPEGFKLKLEKYNIDLEITAINNNQIMRFGIEYFEGMVKFNGTHQGTGFLEMTGY